MAAVRGRDATIYVDQIDASEYLNEYEMESEGDDIDVTHFGASDKVYLSGPKENTVTLTGFWGGSSEALDAILDYTFGQRDNIITICPAGALSGRDCYLTPATQLDYTVGAEVDGATEAEAGFRSRRVRGVLLKTPVAVTATGNGTAYEEEHPDALALFGLSAHLHVLAVGGTVAPTAFEVVVEHSTDGTTWLPLLTFASQITPGVQRLTTSKTATVHPHLRAQHTVTGGTSPSVSYVLAVGRGV